MAVGQNRTPYKPWKVDIPCYKGSVHFQWFTRNPYNYEWEPSSITYERGTVPLGGAGRVALAYQIPGEPQGPLF